MPHKRSVQKGSFGGHIDELVKTFPPEKSERRAGDRPAGESKDDRHINDRLFESAWRKGKDRPPA